MSTEVCGLNLLLAPQMNSVYALFFTVFLLLTGGSAPIIPVAASQVHTVKQVVKAQQYAGIQKQAKIKGSGDTQAPGPESYFLSDNSDLSDHSESLSARYVVLWAFNFFALCCYLSKQRSLPFCCFIPHLGSSRYIIYRSFRV
jgi:hypothetical protein